MNGFNETPLPADLRDDLREAVRSFRGSLGHRPGWVEAEVGLVGCWSNLLYLARDDEAQQREILAEGGGPMVREMMIEKGSQNPRVLWIVGGLRLRGRPPQGGDAARAVSTYQEGLEAARREAVQEDKAPSWVPTWGGPEILMSLAYVYSHSSLQNRELAQAYVDGALTAVPDWHYVADVLRPQVQALAPPAK